MKRTSFLICATLLAAACGRGGRGEAALASRGAPLEAPPRDPLGLTDGEKQKLQAAPLAELAFVPADVEAVIRIDLGALAAGNDATAKTVDFLLRAQQPAAWEVLRTAGITAGKELSSLYLVVGQGASDKDAFLIAGAGQFDGAKLAAALRTASHGAAVLEPVGDATLFTYEKPQNGKIGAFERADDKALPDQAIGVTDGLVLLGPPDLVRHALAARAGETPDVRRSPLAHELAAVDTSATAWGAGAGGYLASLIPGLVTARFHTALASVGDGIFELRAVFGSHEEAEAFHKQLTTLLQQVAAYGAGSAALGATLGKLRDSTHVEIDGAVLTAAATL